MRCACQTRCRCCGRWIARCEGFGFEAAAGPRDEAIPDDVATVFDRLYGWHRAMKAAAGAPPVCPVCKLGWDRHKDVDA